MAAYPSAIKSFSTKTDHVDHVMSVHVNDIQDEITAIETEIGTLPKGGYGDVTARLTDLVDKTNAQTVAGVKTLTAELQQTAVATPSSPSSNNIYLYTTASGTTPNREIALKCKNEAGIETVIYSWLV